MLFLSSSLTVFLSKLLPVVLTLLHVIPFSFLYGALLLRLLPFNAKQDWLTGCFYGQREGRLMQATVVGGGSPKNRYILSQFVLKEICAPDFLRILHPDFEGEATDFETQQTTQQTSNNRNVKELDT